MRDANGREIVVGDRVRVIYRRMVHQPTGVIYAIDGEFAYMRSADEDDMERGMLPENIAVIDDDLTMDEGL